MPQDDSIPFTMPVNYYSTLLWHHFLHTLLITVFQLCVWQFKTNYWSMGDNKQYSKEVLICHLSLSLFFLVTLLSHLITLYLKENKSVLVMKTFIAARDHTTHTHTHTGFHVQRLLFLFILIKIKCFEKYIYEILWKAVQWESLCSMNTDRWAYKMKPISCISPKIYFVLPVFNIGQHYKVYTS